MHIRKTAEHEIEMPRIALVLSRDASGDVTKGNKFLKLNLILICQWGCDELRFLQELRAIENKLCFPSFGCRRTGSRIRSVLAN